MNNLGLGIIVSLKDAFTQNASRVQSSMETLDASVEKASENMTRNLGLIEKGTMMVGAGLALLAVPTALVASTAATQQALGELASVGIRDFKAMEDAAEAFTNQWAGASKSDFIGAAYDVKSALDNLSDQAVGTFAAMAAITGKATKATTQEMVETFTTAYGIFKPIMKDMSDMDWAQMFSGALSETVGIFKTSGPAMARAIKNIGAIAAASNIPLQEQMAIMGQLQTTMRGGEAGTLYKAFMLRVAEAGEELGLSFIGPTGRLKDIVSILKELKRGFPDLSDAMTQVKLKEAFGSAEAVRFVLQMSMGLEQLEGNIKSIEKAMKSGTAVTLEMAEAMNADIGSQFALVRQQVGNLAEILGRTLLPVVIPVFQAVSRFIIRLQGIAKSVPGVTRAILTLCVALGAALVVVGSVTAALGTVGIMLPAIKAGIAALGPMLAGAGSAVSASFWPVVAVIAAVVIAVVALKRAWETNFSGIRDFVIGAWNRVSLAFQGIRALIGSLSGGSGQMSAELAKKLEAAGLMKFVTTVFQVYYRVRQFLSGLWQAFSSVFGKIRAILEPAVRALMGAFGEIGKALGSVFAAFGLATTVVDASSFKSFGQILGTILGIIAQVAAYVIKFIVYPLSWMIRTIAVVVQAIVWFGKTIATAFVATAPYVYKFFLPLRMLVQGLLMVGRVAHTVWRMITGDISVVDGLKAIGGAVFGFLATPFLWARDVIAAVWQAIVSAASAAWSSIRAMASSAIGWLQAPFVSLTRAASSPWGAVMGAVSGAFSFVISSARNLVSAAFQSGRSVMITIADGIRSAAAAPFEAAKAALSRLRRLLPFSDAKEGPLSTITRSGSALLEAFSSGIARASELPSRALESSLGTAASLLAAGLPAGALAAALALTPVVNGSLSADNATGPVDKGMDRTRLLAVTHNSPASGPGAVHSEVSGDIRALLGAILSKLDSLSERPVEVSVTTKLDGRQIAQAVYKDMKEQRVRNYESA